jgi:glycosyltransferase involved in cell wall biosynthesis
MTDAMHVIAFGLRGMEGIEGGIETHAASLYPHLKKSGCHIEVLSRSRYTIDKRPHEFEGVRVTPLWAPRGEGIEAFVHSFIGLLYATLKRPDLIHIHGIGPAIFTPLARAASLRVVVTHHGQDYDAAKWGGAAQTILRIGEWAGMTFANQCIVVSEQLRTSVGKKFHRDCVVIRNSVAPVTPTQDMTLISALGLTPRRYLLEVARFTEHKGQDLLIQAFNQARLNGWKLVLVGGASSSDPFATRVARLAAGNDNVVLAGFRSGNELAQLYSHAGIFALPSSYEGMPIAALEAMAHGLPVILSDVPAHLELNLPKNHYFATHNCDALCERIRTVANITDLPETRARMRETVQAIPGWEEVAQQTFDVFRAAVRPRIIGG